MGPQNRAQQRNIAAVLCDFLLAAITLGLAERLRRRGVPTHLTRKLVYVTAGTSPFVILPLATSRWAGLLPYLLTIPMNLVLWRRRLLRSLDSSDHTPGIVYFPVAQSVLIFALWVPGTGPTEKPALFSALMTLAWSDALAALVGQSVGKHRYGRAGRTKSVEGSAAMFVSTATATILFHRATVEGSTSLRCSLLAASAATVAEGLSHDGLDNLTAPLMVALVLYRAAK